MSKNRKVSQNPYAGAFKALGLFTSLTSSAFAAGFSFGADSAWMAWVTRVKELLADLTQCKEELEAWRAAWRGRRDTAKAAKASALADVNRKVDVLVAAAVRAGRGHVTPESARADARRLPQVQAAVAKAGAALDALYKEREAGERARNMARSHIHSRLREMTDRASVRIVVAQMRDDYWKALRAHRRAENRQAAYAAATAELARREIAEAQARARAHFEPKADGRMPVLAKKDGRARMRNAAKLAHANRIDVERTARDWARDAADAKASAHATMKELLAELDF